MIPVAVLCALAAAAHYRIPADALLAVYSVEGGHAYTWSPDSNGTADVGELQFNTAYLQSLRRFGITPKDVEGHSCYPWFLAAWRIRGQLIHAGPHTGFWTAIAHYHSETPAIAAAYRRKLLRYAPAWRQWIKTHFPTYTVH